MLSTMLLMSTMTVGQAEPELERPDWDLMLAKPGIIVRINPDGTKEYFGKFRSPTGVRYYRVDALGNRLEAVTIEILGLPSKPNCRDTLISVAGSDGTTTYVTRTTGWTIADEGTTYFFFIPEEDDSCIPRAGKMDDPPPPIPCPSPCPPGSSVCIPTPVCSPVVITPCVRPVRVVPCSTRVTSAPRRRLFFRR